jgi:tyrosinase
MSTIRYRRNINCLTSDQLHDLREALAALYQLPESDAHSFAKIAGLHGFPSPSYCIHGAPGFLTWHRAYMLAYEKALQCVNSSVMLPFWDWSSGPSTGVPTACSQPTYVNRAGNTVANPLYSGPLPGGGGTARRPDINTTSFNDLATTAQTAMSNSSFSSFQGALNSVHGGVHVRVGGQMASVPYAAFDPIFYLHHGNVDRLWAQWQQSHPGPLPSNEANLELEPFNKPYSTEWQRGSAYQSTTDVGYRYTNFCFFLPPIIIWEAIAIEPIPPEVLERLNAVRLVLHSQRMQARSMDIRVFVNQPRATERSKTIDNPRFAGAFGIFGMSANGAPDLHMVAREQNFDLELDITQAIRQMGAEDKELNLKLVAVDANGEAVPAEQIDVERVELLVD